MVSVIVTTYNRPHLLADALHSIQKQTYQDFEIIVVNDGGVEIEHIVSRLHKNNITYIKHSMNKGPAAAKNTGLKLVKGKYIAYLDDDDNFYPDHLETLIRILEASNYKVAYTDAYRAFQKKAGEKYIVIERDLPYSFDFDYNRILVSNFIPTLCFMHEKSCLDKVGYFDETLRTHEDWDLWIRMSRKYKFVHEKKITAEFTWRRDGTSITSKNRLDFLKTLEIIYKKNKKYIKYKPKMKKAQKKFLQQVRNEINSPSGFNK